MITEGHLARHYQGRAAGRGPAIIDIAQDHLMYHLNEAGIMDLGAVLKGGTAIRKLRAGNAGRFSTDLDFGGLTDEYADLLLEAADGAEVGPFRFSVVPLNGTLRARLDIESSFGKLEIPARLDLGRRGVWLPPERLPVIELPIHRQYGFIMPTIATPRVEEVIAEKLARYRRSSLARDLYDLAWFVSRPFDEALVRRVTMLKVWGDVNDDRLGKPPFEAADVLASRSAGDFEPEAIGYLTTPVDVPRWVSAVRERYAFLGCPDELEVQLSKCSRGDRWLVEREIAELASR